MWDTCTYSSASQSSCILFLNKSVKLHDPSLQLWTLKTLRRCWRVIVIVQLPIQGFHCSCPCGNAPLKFLYITEVHLGSFSLSEFKKEICLPSEITSVILVALRLLVMGITFYIYRAENEKSLSPDTSSTDVKSFFSNCNVAALRQLGGGRVLLDLCLSLPEFSKIITPQPSSSSSLISLTSSRWAL